MATGGEFSDQGQDSSGEFVLLSIGWEQVLRVPVNSVPRDEMCGWSTMLLVFLFLFCFFLCFGVSRCDSPQQRQQQMHMICLFNLLGKGGRSVSVRVCVCRQEDSCIRTIKSPFLQRLIALPRRRKPRRQTAPGSVKPL